MGSMNDYRLILFYNQSKSYCTHKCCLISLGLRLFKNMYLYANMKPENGWTTDWNTIPPESNWQGALCKTPYKRPSIVRYEYLLSIDSVYTYTMSRMIHTGSLHSNFQIWWVCAHSWCWLVFVYRCCYLSVFPPLPPSLLLASAPLWVTRLLAQHHRERVTHRTLCTFQ